MASSDTNHDFPRIEPRYRLNDGIDVRVLVQAQGSPEPVDAQLIDMSNSGLQLRLATCLKFDESMAVHILAGDLQFDLAATVKWIREADEQSWSIGCHIKPELSEEALNRLASMGLLDRRESVRKEVEMAASICGELETNKTPAVIRNLSEEGFGMATMTARVVGQRIRVAVPTPFDDALDVTARVIWQIKTNRGFFCGCAFLSRESHAELSALAGGTSEAAAHARRRRRRRSTRRTSLWVALAALVVFVFPSLIVVLMDHGDAKTAATNGAATTEQQGEARGAGRETREPGVPNDAPPAANDTSDAVNTPSISPATNAAADATAEPRILPIELPIEPSDAANEPPNEPPIATSFEPTNSPSESPIDPSTDAAEPPTESLAVAPLASEPLVAAAPYVPADETAPESNLPPEIAAELDDWLSDRLSDAVSLTARLNHLSRQHPAEAGFGIQDSGSPNPEARSPNPAPSAPRPAPGFRTWVDRTGKYRVVARIDAVDGGTVRLLKENGRYATVPLDRLSKDDVEYARRWAALPR
jgi:hypothetical protein